MLRQTIAATVLVNVYHADDACTDQRILLRQSVGSVHGAIFAECETCGLCHVESVTVTRAGVSVQARTDPAQLSLTERV